MLEKVITYTDYDGEERKETFLFNLTKAELTMMDFSETGGMERKLRRIIETKDAPAIMATFKELIHKSYGEKSPDGRRFIKNDELSTQFEQTEAYSELFMELCTNADAAAAFVQGILPKDLSKAVQEKSALPASK